MTLMLQDVPVIELLALSVAVMVWFPTIRSVALKVPTPPVRPELPGRLADPSVLLKRTVPAYPVTTLLNASSAVTVKLLEAPAIALDGAATL